MENKKKTTLYDLFGYDTTPLDTDWEDFDKLQEDMLRFGVDHPNHIFLSADDPGCNHSPPREPRLGWVAYRDTAGDENADEDIHSWTITMANMKRWHHKRKTAGKQDE